MKQRLLFYSHDSFGLGHFRRSLSIATELTKHIKSSSALMLTGLDSPANFEAPRGVDFVKLPGIAKFGPEQYESRHLRVSFSRVQRIREQLIHGVVRSYDPALFVVDNVPKGVEGELIPSLEYLKRKRPHTRVVLTLRDVLDSPSAIVPLWRRSGVYDVLEEFYDEIWVVGCRSVFDPVALYELPNGVAKKVKFCGYVVRPGSAQETEVVARELAPEKGPIVTVSCGGGGDGYQLVDAYVKAGERLAHEGVRSCVFLGPDMPASERNELKRQLLPLSESIFTFDYRNDLMAFLLLSSACVSMAGYNTICELVSLQKPTTVVPRVYPRTEQLLRAQALAERGLLDVILPDLLSSDALFESIRTTLERARPDGGMNPHRDLDFDGLRRIAEHAREQLRISGER